MQIDLTKQLFLVLGLGQSGMATLRWLVAQGATVRAADSQFDVEQVKRLQAEYPEVSVVAGEFENSLLDQVGVIVVSPGISTQIPLLQAAQTQGIEIIGDVELFAQFRPSSAKVVGITGSNGKTTVTSLVGKMCEAAGLKTIVAGNIGLPVMQALAEPTPDVYVLELSSFQLETTSNLTLDAATMLNLTEDHMDRYDEIQSYAIAKARIFYHAHVQVLNRDDAWSMLMARPQLKQVTFGLSAPEDKADFGLVEGDNGLWLAHGVQQLMNVSDLKLIGAHNMANAMAAMGLCDAIAVPQHAMLEALYAFNGLPHRVQWVAEHLEVDYFNDSKATNVGATIAAVEGLKQPVVLIAGGEGKGQDFSPMTKVAEQLTAVVLIGRDAALIEEVLLQTSVPMYQALDMSEAVNISKKLAKAGDAVLLSPACASFDMFENYQHRGEVFISAVQQLTQASEVQQ